MTTKKQIEANRRNAKKSTGPKTEEGKAKCAMNATKHGLTSRRVVLDDEDEQGFREFRHSIFDDLEPNGELETALALRIAEKLWRLRRVAEIEADLLERLRDKAGDDSLLGGQGAVGQGSFGRGVSWLGAAWLADGGAYGGALARLARYETALERGVTRLTGELRRAQKERAARERRWVEVETREARRQAEDGRRYPLNRHASPVYDPNAPERRGEGTLYGDLPVGADAVGQAAEGERDRGVRVVRRVLRKEPIAPATDAGRGADLSHG